MDVGNQIKRLRLQKGVKQEDLAAYLHISKQAVSKWETGTSTPDIELLPRIAVYFGVTIDELFLLEEEAEFERIENRFFSERSLTPMQFERTERFLITQTQKRKWRVRAYECLAYLYNQRAKRDRETALDYAKTVNALAPDSKRGWVACIEACGGLCGDGWTDNHFDLIEYLKEYLKAHPDCIYALDAVIRHLIADGRMQEAKAYADALISRTDDSRGLRILGDLALAQCNREEALRLWDRSVEQHPDEWQAYCARADRLRRLGLYERAAEDYETSIRLQAPPRIVDGWFSLAQMHEARGDYGAAIETNHRILQCLHEDYGIEEGEQIECLRREIGRLQIKNAQIKV